MLRIVGHQLLGLFCILKIFRSARFPPVQVMESMVANRVAGIQDLLKYFRMFLHIIAYTEKCRGGVEFL